MAGAGVKFNVRNSDGVRFPYTLDLEKTTVGSLKAMVARDSGVASEEQRLYSGGMEMEDYRMLSFYGIAADSEIRLKEWSFETRLSRGRCITGNFLEDGDSSSGSDSDAGSGAAHGGSTT